MHRTLRAATRKNKIELYPGGQKPATIDTESNTKIVAGLRKKIRLSQELPQNVATARANRFAHANFFCPLGHAHQHDVHDSDAGSEQGDEADNKCANPHDTGYRHKRALQGIVRINLEIVFLIRT